MSAHDRHLAQYREYPGEVECPKCERIYSVTVFSEYGQCWIEPEECICGCPVPANDIQEPEPPERDDVY